MCMLEYAGFDLTEEHNMENKGFEIISYKFQPVGWQKKVTNK